MKKSEVFSYLVNKELEEEKGFSNVKKQQIEKKIEKKINTQGTKEKDLFELYSLYYEEEDQTLINNIGDRILLLMPNDYDIKSDKIYNSNLSPVEKIKKLKELEKECVSYLKELDYSLDGSEDIFNYLEGREYIRLLDKIAVLYLDINQKEEYAKRCEQILLLNQEDSLDMLDSLSLYYFNKREYKKIQDLYNKHQHNLILQTLDYVIKFQEGKDVKKEMEALLKRNHFIVYYFANYLDLKQKALDTLKNIEFFPYGSLEETLLALLDIEDSLNDEALEIYISSFIAYKGDEIVDYLSLDELNAMMIIMEEFTQNQKDPTIEKVHQKIKEKHDRAISNKEEYVPNCEKQFLEELFNKMVKKHLIEIQNVRIVLTLGGLMHVYTMINYSENKDEEIIEEETLIS